MINRKLRNRLIVLVLLSLTVYYGLLSFNKKPKSRLRQKVISSDLLKKIQAVKVFCIIQSDKIDFDTDTKLSQLIWSSECDGFYFVDKIQLKGFQNEANEPSEDPSLKEMQRKTTENIYKSMLHVHKEYNKHFDFFIKLDDRTFLFMDHLKEFLASKNPGLPSSYGYQLRNGVYSSGAGYVLSSAALHLLGSKLNENFNYCDNSGREDADVSLCMNKAGINADKSTDEEGKERFHPFDPQTHVEGNFTQWWKQQFIDKPPNIDNCCSENLATFHRMSRDQMTKLYQVIKEYELKAEQDADNKLLFALNYYISLREQ